MFNGLTEQFTNIGANLKSKATEAGDFLTIGLKKPSRDVKPEILKPNKQAGAIIDFGDQRATEEFERREELKQKVVERKVSSLVQDAMVLALLQISEPTPTSAAQTITMGRSVNRTMTILHELDVPFEQTQHLINSTQASALKLQQAAALPVLQNIGVENAANAILRGTNPADLVSIALKNIVEDRIEEIISQVKNKPQG